MNNLRNLIFRIDNFKNIIVDPSALISSPPSEDVIENAKTLINRISPKIRNYISTDNINVTPHNSIHIKIESDQNILEIEVLEKGTTYRCVKSNVVSQLSDVKKFKNLENESLRKLYKAIEWLEYPCP